MWRFIKIFFTVYFWTILFAASPLFMVLALFLWIRRASKARKAKALYKMMTAPPRPGSERWDRTVGGHVI